MRARRSDRSARSGAVAAAGPGHGRAADSAAASMPGTRAGCPFDPGALAGEVALMLPRWLALVARLREDSTDRAITDAIDAATEVR